MYSDCMTYTSIQIQPETREKLAHLKSTARETYDELRNKRFALVPSRDDEGAYTEEFRLGLLNARLETVQGKTESHKRAKELLGL